MAACPLPEPGQEAVLHRSDIGRPVWVPCKHALLGANAIEQRRPARQHHERRAQVPFLHVVADVGDEVGEVHRVAHEPIGPRRRHAAQGRAHAEAPAERQEAREAEQRGGRHQHLPFDSGKGSNLTDFSQIENSIIQVKKRDGRVSDFQRDKISSAIYKALVACGRSDHGLADKLANHVLTKLVNRGFSSSEAPSVEDVQDMVESTLIEEGLGEIAKAYILYRHERRRVREEKMKALESKALDSVAKRFDLNCLRVLASRYLLRNNKGQITESPGEMFERVAILVGIADIIRDPSVFQLEGGNTQNTEEAARYLDKLDDFNYKFKIG